MIKARISGIPCLIDPTYVFTQNALGPSCDSDMDCYGYSEIEFTVCDRRGRPAPWLEKKMTKKEEEKIETLILENTND